MTTLYKFSAGCIPRHLFLFMFMLIVAACGGGGSSSNGGSTGGDTSSIEIGINGGIATSDDGLLTVSIPAGALSASKTITVSPVTSVTSGIIGSAYEIGPEGLSFDQPVTVSLKYDATSLPAGFSEDGLSLSRLFNGYSWNEIIGASVDSANNTVSVDTYSFSTYGLNIGSFAATLDGSMSGSTATGTALFDIDIESNLLSYNVSYAGLVGDETSSHIYGSSNTSLHELKKGSTKVDVWHYSEADEADILAGKMYVNILTDSYPAGEIRGQIEPLGPTGTQSTVTVRLVLWDDLLSSGPGPIMPVTVSKVDIQVSASDMAQQDLQADILNSPVQESFQIAKGLVRRFDVLAYDSTDQLIYRGVGYRNILNDVEDVRVTMVDTTASGDSTAPTFAGITGAYKLSGDTLSLAWSAATDDNSETAAITYLIYAAASPAGQNFTEPMTVTKSGETSYSITGLASGTVYYFVVRAMDQSGNIDTNGVEVSANTYSAGTGLYVNVNSGDDSNSNCGSTSAPCKTITHALQKTAGNEPVYVARGIYDGSSGETFPLQLKSGTALHGELKFSCISIKRWVGSGWFCSGILVPATIIRSSTQESIIIGADNVFIGALNIGFDPNPLASQPVIDNDGKAAEIRYVALVGDGIISTGIKLTGGHSSVKSSLVSGFELSGIAAYGDQLRISSNTLNENTIGMGVESENAIISRNYVDHNTHAFNIGSIAGSSSSIVFGNTVSRSYRGLGINSGGIEVNGNRIDNNEDYGIRIFNDDALSDPVILRNNRIYQNGIGISVRYRANAIINGNDLVCNDVWDLQTDSTRQIDARYNLWDHSPPTVDPGSLLGYFDCDGSGDTDICYSRDYSGTPEPISTPQNGTSGCSSGFVIPY